jgi:hypothetical protein
VPPAQRSENDDSIELTDNPPQITETPTLTPTLRRSQRTTTSHFRVRFADDMAASTNSKTYKPHNQFLQQGIDEYNANHKDTKTLQRYITGFIMTQMTAKAGIKKHGQLAVDALLKEFQQLHDKSVFEGIDPAKLTKAQKYQAL